MLFILYCSYIFNYATLIINTYKYTINTMLQMYTLFTCMHHYLLANYPSQDFSTTNIY